MIYATPFDQDWSTSSGIFFLTQFSTSWFVFVKSSLINIAVPLNRLLFVRISSLFIRDYYLTVAIFSCFLPILWATSMWAFSRLWLGIVPFSFSDIFSVFVSAFSLPFSDIPLILMFFFSTVPFKVI